MPNSTLQISKSMTASYYSFLTGFPHSVYGVR